MLIASIFLFTIGVACSLSFYIIYRCYCKRISFLEHYYNKLNEFVDYHNKARDSHKALEKELSDRVHELYVDNEKYRLAINKLLYIIRDEQFNYKTAYNLSDDLDELFDILWQKYGSKNPNEQASRPYKSISEMSAEASQNRDNNTSDNSQDSNDSSN